MAALIAEGTEGLTIDGCRFSRLDGNAIMISGYARNATVNSSDFHFIGGTAVATWGRTEEITDNGRNGFDATAGDFPHFVTISNNLVDTFGLWQKQASAYFQAKAAQNMVRSNIIQNGPRAGINFVRLCGLCESPFARVGLTLVPAYAPVLVLEERWHGRWGCRGG